MMEKEMVCVALLTGAMALGAGELKLAVRGEKSPYVVTTGEKPAPSVKFAATELRDYVKRITGVELAVAEKSAAPTRVEIALAADPETLSPFDVAHDVFTLKAKDGVLRVTGGRRGVLYGVYELLERFGGCGWYASEQDGSTFTVAPEAAAFAVPDDLDDAQRPAFARRWMDWGFIYGRVGYAAANRINAEPTLGAKQNARYGGCYPAFAPGFGACHNFGALVPESEYFDKHPEYFSLVKGERRRRSKGGQLCLTNPDVFDIVLKKTLAAIERDRKGGYESRRIYGVSQDDWNGYCECTNCAAIDAREESHSGALIEFINHLAEEVEKKYPDVIIETLAYMYSRKPPKNLRVRDNVMPCLCSIECDFRHPFGESPYAENVRFADDLKKWRAITKHLYVWDYTACFRYYTVPYPNLDTLAPNLRFFRDNGVTEVFEEGLCSCAWGHLSALNAWLIAKLEWNPDRPVRPLVDRFLANYYGKAAPFVRTYIDEMQKLDWDVAKDPMKYNYEVPVKTEAIPDAFLDRAVELWRQAEEAAKSESPRVRDHVETGVRGIEYAKVVRYLHKYWGAPVKAKPVKLDVAGRVRFDDVQALAKRFVAWEKTRMKGSQKLGSRLHSDRLMHELQAFAAFDPDQDGRTTAIEDWLLTYVNWPETPKIKRVDDKDALNGRALRITDDPGRHKVWLRAGDIAFDGGVTYRLRVRAKVMPQEGADPAAVAFRTGVNHPGDKPAVKSFSVTLADADGQYRWYDLGEWKFGGGADKLWITPEKGRVVFIDCYELSRP